jgi:hypothetical protein
MTVPRSDYTARQYRDSMVALVALLLRRGISPAEIGTELRRAPGELPIAALELADDFQTLRGACCG